MIYTADRTLSFLQKTVNDQRDGKMRIPNPTQSFLMVIPSTNTPAFCPISAWLVIMVEGGVFYYPITLMPVAVAATHAQNPHSLYCTLRKTNPPLTVAGEDPWRERRQPARR